MLIHIKCYINSLKNNTSLLRTILNNNIFFVLCTYCFNIQITIISIANLKYYILSLLINNFIEISKYIRFAIKLKFTKVQVYIYLFSYALVEEVILVLYQHNSNLFLLQVYFLFHPVFLLCFPKGLQS